MDADYTRKWVNIACRFTMFEAEAKKRQQAAGEQYGRGMDEKVVEILPQPISGEKSRDAAAAVGVSGKYVSDIKAISKKAPELLQKIESGSMTIPEAKRQMSEPPPPDVKPPIRWNVVRRYGKIPYVKTSKARPKPPT